MITIKKITTMIVVLFSVNFYAQEIVTDRPDQTESSQTIEKKSFQIESGISFENSNNNSIKNFSGPSTLLRYGISNIVELRFVSEYQSTKIALDEANIDFKGFNDLEFGVKIQLLKNKNINTEIALLSHLVIPTAKTALTTDNFGVVNKLAISHSISERIGIGYNIGYDLVAQQSALTYSVALGFSISNTVGVYIEPYGFWAEQNHFESNFDAGFTFLVKPNFQLDVSYGIGLNNDMQYVAAGFSWKIQKLFVKK